MKGVIGIQFNWIFALIVGMVLLGLFFVQMDNAAKKSRYESSLSLRASLQGMFVTTESDSHKTIELGLVTLTNICEPEASTFYLGKGSLPVDTTYYALHAPFKISSRKLHLQVVDNIPMLNGEDRIYYFVENAEFESQISYYYNLLEGKKQIIGQNEVTDYPPKDSPYKSTMIYFDNSYSPAELQYNGLASNFEIVVVDPDEGRSSGTLYFGSKVQKPTVNDRAVYMNQGELLGGIIDSKHDIYTCTHKQQLMKEYRNVLLLREKINIMLSQADESCEALLGLAYYYVGSETLMILGNLTSDNPAMTETQYLDSLNRINNLNKDLARNACPTII